MICVTSEKLLLIGLGRSEGTLDWRENRGGFTPHREVRALEEALTSYRSARQILEDRNELKGFASACLLANMATLEADAAGDSCDSCDSLNLFEEAKKLFQEAEALDTEEGADLLVNLAAQCLKTGEVDSALQHLHEAREIFQSQNLLEDSLAGVKFWMNLGSALMQKGIQNESIESVESLSLARLCDRQRTLQHLGR